MNILVSIILFLIFTPCFSQTKQQKLIVAEYESKNSENGNYTYLVSYNFTNGVFTSKDTIFSAGTSKNDAARSYLRFELGKNYIYKNRYVISSTGNVIDLKTKTLVIEDHDDFVEALGDTLIFHRNNVYKGTGFLMLNLSTGKYNFINNEEWDKKRIISPDKRQYLSIDKSNIPYKIWLHDTAGNKRIIVNDAGHGPGNIYSSEFPTIETHWLNNSSFLYAVHKTNPGNTKKSYSKVTIRQFDIDNDSDRVFFTLDSVGHGWSNGTFYLDNIGQTIYTTAGGTSYIIDTLNSSLKKYPFFEKGYQFSISGQSTKQGRIIRYKNVDIGTLWSNSEVVSDRIIAMAYGEVVSKNIWRPKGIKIWSYLTNTWTTFNIPWLSRVIGWVDEDINSID